MEGISPHSGAACWFIIVGLTRSGYGACQVRDFLCVSDRHVIVVCRMVRTQMKTAATGNRLWLPGTS
jgi:hypothetical protein